MLLFSNQSYERLYTPSVFVVGFFYQHSNQFFKKITPLYSHKGLHGWNFIFSFPTIFLKLQLSIFKKTRCIEFPEFYTFLVLPILLIL